MIRLATDKTIALLIWFLVLGVLNRFFIEELPVLKQAEIKKIDLNRASLEDLMQIPRLSFKTAQSILEARNKRGCFRTFEELDAVSGVGPTTLEKLERFACIGC